MTRPRAKATKKVSPNTLERFGFGHGRGGAHSSRTMMLVELRALLAYVDNADASKADYLEAVQTANCLRKRSGKTRSLTFRHLVELYALDTSFVLFRALRFFWKRDLAGQPLLATLSAYSRDPIFRSTAPFILDVPIGSAVSLDAVEALIESQAPGRFSKATLQSTARNINSSWAQAGHLSGRVRKIRSRAAPTAGSVSLALLLGYLKGLRGEALFQSDYVRLLDCSIDQAIDLAEDASRRGWISLNRVGRVVEVRFPNLITAQEVEFLREQN